MLGNVIFQVLEYSYYILRKIFKLIYFERIKIKKKKGIFCWGLLIKIGKLLKILLFNIVLN